MNEQKQYKITKAVARKVLKTVDAGLVRGLGLPKPGQMCVEAAVCYAFGLPHSDRPPCVGDAVRAFKIRLNDSNWSSDEARSAGMRELSVAQLGSDKIDQNEFRKEVVLGTVQRILPISLRAVAKIVPAHSVALEASAVACEAVTEFAQCYSVAKAAQKTAYAVDSAYAYAADAAADAVADVAADDAADAVADVADAAAYAADAAAYADAAERAQARDSVLRIGAEIGLTALKKLGAEGVKYLPLC